MRRESWFGGGMMSYHTAPRSIQMNRVLGFLLLFVGLGALGFAFAMGIFDGNGFRMETMMRLGGIWAVLGGAVCLFLSYLMLRRKAPTAHTP